MDYGRSFYDVRRTAIQSSARRLVPLLNAWVNPRRVIDVGCDQGTWLAEFHRNGVEEYLGNDGAWVEETDLEIPEEHFQEAALARELPVRGSFDLAISLEVAEHLPPERAEQFILSLCALSPLMLFSAAVPDQGGRGHMNEQWPSYWREHFAKNGRRPLDCARSKIWNNEAITIGYRQNLLFFIDPDSAHQYPNLPNTSLAPLDVVHPALWQASLDPASSLVRQQFTGLWGAFRQAARHRFRRGDRHR